MWCENCNEQFIGKYFDDEDEVVEGPFCSERCLTRAKETVQIDYADFIRADSF